MTMHLLMWLIVVTLPSLAWSATPLIEWRMDDVGWNGVPNVVTNAVANRYHGTWVNPAANPPALSPVLAGATGTCGYGQFSATSYIDAGTPNLALTDQLTVMAWLRWDIDPATGTPRATLLASNSPATPNDGQFWLQHNSSNNRYEWAVQTTDGTRTVSASASPRPVMGQWQHVAGVYDGATLTLYVNGAKNGSLVHTGQFFQKPTYQLQAGRRAHNTGEFRAFQGAMDEIRLYNAALSASEVYQAMQKARVCDSDFTSHLAPAPQPVIDVHMDERLWRSTTEPVRDSSDNAFHGVARHGAALAIDSPALPGSKGTCGYGAFDGVAQYVDFGTPNLGLTDQVTVMAWVRWDIDPRTGNPSATIVTNNRFSSSEQGQFWLQHNSDNSRFEFVVQTTSGKKRLLSTTQPEQGVWYYVAGVYDSRNVMIFVNGALENHDTHVGALLPQSDNQLTVARWSHTSQNYRAFHGNIDEVRLYSQGLSAAAMARAAAAKHTCVNTTLATPPQLDITSHTSGTGALPTGFTLSGSVGDAANDLVKLLITIDDPILGRTVDRRLVEVDAQTGAWTFVVAAARVSPGQTATITLTAVDAEQVKTTKTIQVQVASHPVALWHLDAYPTWSGALGEVADTSGSQFHGRAINGAANGTASPPLPGSNGTCGYGTFNGSDQHLALGNPNFSGLDRQLTVMAWVRWAIDPLTGNPRATIITNNRETASDSGQFWLHHKFDNTGFVFAVQTDVGRQEVRSTTPPQPGVWYHVAGIYDGSWLRLVVNGVEEGAMAHSGHLLFDPDNRLTIGYSAHASNTHRAFRGDIDEVQVHKNALSAAQVAALAAARHSCLPDPAMPPVLTIVSHHDGDAVLYNGFTLTGLVSDGGSPVQTIVDVDDPLLGRTVNGRAASINTATGQWTLAVAAHEISPNRNITVTVRALDSDGKETQLRLKLAVVPPPFALWHLEASQQWQGTPGEVIDASSRGYSGQSIHGAQVRYDTPALGNSAAGTCGYATFDGALQYIALGAPDLGLASDVTVMAWVRWDIDPATGNPQATLVSNNSNAALDSGQFWLWHNWSNAQFAFTVKTSVGLLSVTSVTQPQAGQWYHVAGVYDGSMVSIYVNGVEERRKPHSGTFTYNPAYQLQFARWAFPSQNYRAFAGSLDEVQIHKRALAAQDIAALASAQRDCPAAPALTVAVDADSMQPLVQDNGLLVSGVVSSGYTLTTLEVRLIDPVSGQTLAQYPANVTPQGRWAVLIDSGLLTPGQRVRVKVTAVDTSGNTSRQTFSVKVVPFDRRSRQLINRITFGATPDLLAEVASLGATNFLAQQLAPETIDDQAFESLVAGFEPADPRELQNHILLYAIHSRRQLREVMTWFWDNHFSTNLGKHFQVAYEFAENHAFRAQALGRFRDLLGISAKSPAMLIFLDNAASQKTSPNENYARELMELHTLGVNGGYTQTDVEQVAKAFTGWRVMNNAFFFHMNRHNTDTKTVLGQVIPAGGIDEGEAILDLLASHPSTARFICTKLAQLLVSDTPPETLVQRCKTKFLNTSTAANQMAQVVELLLTSTEFAQAEHYRSKFKTPLEFVVGTLRHLQATPGTNDVNKSIEQMGQIIFRYPLPTGYDETGAYWLNTYQLAERIKFVNRVAQNTPGSNQTSLDPVAFFMAHGRDTAESIVHFLCNLVFGNDYTQLEWTIARDVLTDNGTTVFDIHAPDAERKLRQLLGTVLSYPNYLYQ